jgi:hypothetical protein
MNEVVYKAYSLEDLCKNYEDLDYLVYEILNCEMDIHLDGMEYALIYLKNIINAMEARLDAYDEDPDQSEMNLISYLIKFMDGKDEQTLISVQGA